MSVNFASRRGLMKALLLMPFGAGALAPLRANAASAASDAVQGSCTLFPKAVEGPYYFDPALVRRDITEGRPGLPVELYIKVMEQGPCTPMPKLRVDIWHADATGIYSGYGRQGDDRNVSTKGQTYLRGTQMTAEDGTVLFETVYPGWYPGRTPHVHMKVFLDDKTLVTGQIYFPDDLSRRIYETHAAYRDRGTADTTNDRDFIFKSGMAEGGGIVFTMNQDAEPLRASLVIAVDRSGKAGVPTKGWGKRVRDRLGL